MMSLTRATATLPEAAFLILLVIVPSYFNPHSTYSFEPDKLTWVRAGGIISLSALWFGLRPRWRPIWALPLLWGLAQALATVTSLDSGLSLWGSDERLWGLLTNLSWLCLFFALAPALSSLTVRLRLLRAAVWGSIPLLVFAVAQGVGWDPPGILAASSEPMRVTASLGNPLFLAGYLAMLISITGYLSWRSRDRIRLVYGTLAGIQAIALILTQSRGAWLGLLAAIWLALLLIAACGGRRRMALSIIIASLVGGILLVAINLQPAEGLRTVPVLGRLTQMGAPGSTGAQRLLIWQGAVDAITTQPTRLLSGWGPEAIPLAYYPYYSPQLAAYEPDGVVRLPDRIHNLLGDAFMEGGLVGLGATLLIWGGAFGIGLRRLGLLASPGEHITLLAAVLTGMIFGGLLAAAASLTYGGVLAMTGAASGALLALGGWLALRSWRRSIPAHSLSSPQGGETVALLAVLAAHWMDLQFGFVTAATGLLFWLILALLLNPPQSRDERASAVSERARYSLIGIAILAASYGPISGGGLDGLLLGLAMSLVLLAFLFAAHRWPPSLYWGPLALSPLLLSLIAGLLAKTLPWGPLAAWLLLFLCIGIAIAWLTRILSPVSLEHHPIASPLRLWSGGLLALGLLIGVVIRPASADIYHKSGLLLVGQGRLFQGYNIIESAFSWQPQRATYRQSLAMLHLPLALEAADADTAAEILRRGEMLLMEGLQQHLQDMGAIGGLAEYAARHDGMRKG